MTKWKLSAAWANNKKSISCATAHIRSGCGGCCWTKLTYAGKEYEKRFPLDCSNLVVNGTDMQKYINSDNYEKLKDSKYGIRVCEYLEPGVGCKLPIEKRPISCTLFPFVLNKNNTIVLFGRSLLKGYICHKNINMTKDCTVVNNMKDFIFLFGEEQAKNAIMSVLRGEDYYIELTDKFVDDYNKENKNIANGVFPVRKT